MYIKFADYKGQVLSEDDSVLMSLNEFENGGKNLTDIPVTVTKDGKIHIVIDEIEGEMMI